MCLQYRDTALHYAAKYGQLSAAVYIAEQAVAQLNALNDVLFHCTLARLLS